MEKITGIKTSVFAVIATLGSIITSLLGGWDTALQTLLIFMAIDYVTGLIVAGVFKKSNKTDTGGLDSQAGFKGIVKKLMILLFILMGTQLDLFLNVDYIRYGLIIAFLINETTSIIENGGLMGFPIPDILTNALDILKKQKEVNQK